MKTLFRVEQTYIKSLVFHGPKMNLPDRERLKQIMQNTSPID